jgi:Clostripain family
MKRFLRLLVLAFLCAGFAAAQTDVVTRNVNLRPDASAGSVQQSPLAEWTILIFMNGDNNLEGDALINFRQIAKVGSTDKVNVVVQFDRIAKYAHTTPDWSQTLRFRIAKGMEPIPSNAVQDIGEANMGDPAVLAAFVTWGRQAYPAKHYMLIIWDHGQGWRLFLANLLKKDRMLRKSRALMQQATVQGQRQAAATLRTGSGVASPQGHTAPFRSAPGDPFRSASNDETDNDVLYNREIEEGLKQALNRGKLDVIGFDACLMSMVETGYALRDVGKYLVASEELEPGLGWKYDAWLSKLIANPAVSPAEMAKLSVSSYKEYYSNPDNPDPYAAATTMAAVDLGKITELAQSVTVFSETAISHIDSVLQTIIEARSATPAYAPGYQFHHVDLQHFMEQVAKGATDTALQQKARDVIAMIQAAIIDHYAGPERQGPYGSNGLAVYFPATQSEYAADPYAEGGYEKDNTFFPVEFVQNQKWTDFLHEYWSRVP